MSLLNKTGIENNLGVLENNLVPIKRTAKKENLPALWRTQTKIYMVTNCDNYHVIKLMST